MTMQYADAKYAIAFTTTTMCNDEDDPNPMEGVMERYISCALDYRSTEVSTHMN